MPICVEKPVKKFMVVRTPEQKFNQKEVLSPWPRVRKMESLAYWDLEIMFDEGRNCSQGLKIPFKGLPASSKNVTKAVRII
jgi:hypothetical protein